MVDGASNRDFYLQQAARARRLADAVRYAYLDVAENLDKLAEDFEAPAHQAADHGDSRPDQ